MGTAWSATDGDRRFEGRDRSTGALRWTGTRADLVFGSNSLLRALAGASDLGGRERGRCIDPLRLGLRRP